MTTIEEQVRQNVTAIEDFLRPLTDSGALVFLRPLTDSGALVELSRASIVGGAYALPVSSFRNLLTAAKERTTGSSLSDDLENRIDRLTEELAAERERFLELAEETALRTARGEELDTLRPVVRDLAAALAKVVDDAR